MWMLLQAYWQILMLRSSPETIPYSHFLLGITLAFHLLIGIAFGISTQSVSKALLSATLGTVLVVGVSYLLLTLHGVRNRLSQTVSAMAGCEVLIGLMALPVNIWMLSVDKAYAAPPALLALLLVGWNVAVVAHIWRHALGLEKWHGFLYAIGYVIITFTLALLI